YACAFDPQGRHLAVALQSGILRIWDVNSARQVFEAPEMDYVFAFSGDGKRLAAGHGNTVKLWDSISWRELSSLDFSAKVNYEPFQLSPDGSRLLCETSTEGLRPKIRDAKTGREFLVLSNAWNPVRFSTAGSRLLVSRAERESY